MEFLFVSFRSVSFLYVCWFRFGFSHKPKSMRPDRRLLFFFSLPRPNVSRLRWPGTARAQPWCGRSHWLYEYFVFLFQSSFKLLCCKRKHPFIFVFEFIYSEGDLFSVECREKMDEILEQIPVELNKVSFKLILILWLFSEKFRTVSYLKKQCSVNWVKLLFDFYQSFVYRQHEILVLKQENQ